jgi:spore maturation protein CgeB
MKILYVASKYDYGDPSRGLSFEHYNFYDTLAHMGHDITYFDFMTKYQQRGKSAMNVRLRDVVRSEKPDLLFCVLYTDQFDINTMRSISQQTDTITFNWFCDDHWRFDNFSRYWAPAFNWVSTTAASALHKYRQIGYANVIKTQWACNHFLYQPSTSQPDYDVTFIGQPHGTRRQIIAAIRAAGIEVKTWGYGWEAGRLTQEEMIQVFNGSRINLNLSNASTIGIGWRKWLPGHRTPLPQQIKGRNFEIPGCRGFLLTGLAENLEEYYLPGREVDVFTTVEDLVSKIQFYLDNETERQRMAQAGYVRTMAEHTYEKRFNDILATMGLIEPAAVADAVLGAS